MFKHLNRVHQYRLLLLNRCTLHPCLNECFVWTVFKPLIAFISIDDRSISMNVQLFNIALNLTCTCKVCACRCADSHKASVDIAKALKGIRVNQAITLKRNCLFLHWFRIMHCATIFILATIKLNLARLPCAKASSNQTSDMLVG